MVVHRGQPAVCLIVLMLYACSTGQSNASSASAQSPWFIRPHASNIAVLILDFETMRFKAAYFTWQEPCDESHPPVSDEALKVKAGGIFTATGTHYTRRLIEEEGEAREELAFEVARVGDFAILWIPPGDFGGVAISHLCTGQVLFAGSIVHGGRGEQLYPADFIRPDALKPTSRQAPTPQSIDVVVGHQIIDDQDRGLAAWESVVNLNLVNDLAAGPYSVLVYLYPRTVGAFDPAAADWVVLIHRLPVLPTPYAGPTRTPYTP